MTFLVLLLVIVVAGWAIARHEQRQEREARNWFRRHMGWEEEEDG